MLEFGIFNCGGFYAVIRFELDNIALMSAFFVKK